MDDLKLKPCPFCGGDHIKIERIEFSEVMAAVCRDCGAVGPLQAVTSYWSDGDHEHVAGEKWNKYLHHDEVEIRISGPEFMQSVRSVAAEMSDNLPPGSKIYGAECQVGEDPTEAEKPDIPVPPAAPDAAASDKSRTPSSGGEPDPDSGSINQKSLRTGLNDGPLISGHSLEKRKPQPNPKRKEPKHRHPIADEIEAYLEASGRTIEGADLGITGSGLRLILSGATKNPAKKSIKKIRGAIKKRTPTAEAAKAEEPEPVAPFDPISTFLRDQLTKWMAANDLDVSAAAASMLISEAAIHHILAGRLPHPNVIYQVAKFIPEVNTNIERILADRKVQEDASI